LSVRSRPWFPGVPVMNEHLRECLDRAAYCTQLAEAENDPELKAYLLNLAVSWTRAAQENVKGPAEYT
jgi:hypothetical protein